MPAGTEGQFGLLTQTRRAVERVAAYGFSGERLSAQCRKQTTRRTVCHDETKTVTCKPCSVKVVGLQWAGVAIETELQ